MELRQLRYFLAVSELKSFSRASANAHIAQPALSRQVRKLEEELGVLLFVRDGRGASLSPAGERFYAQVKDVLDQLQRTKADIQSMQNVPTGDVLLGVPQQLGPSFIASILRRFRERYPQATVRIIEGFSFQIEEWLDLGRIDIGVVYHPKSMKKLFNKIMFMEELYLVGPAGDPAVSGETCRFDDIMALPLIMPDRPSCLRDQIDREASAKAGEVQVVYEVDSIGAIKELVREEQGYTIMPYSSVDTELRRGEFAAARIVDPAITRPLVVSHSPKTAMSLTTKALMELVVSEVERFATEERWRGSVATKVAV